MIKLESIDKVYRTERVETTALKNINLEINKGEFMAVMGPSGCGKSTLLNIIAGLVSQDGGSVLMDGRPVDHLSPRERDVAMVFQSYALYPHMTVADNMGFGLRMRGPLRRPAFWELRIFWIESLGSSQEDSDSGWPWAGRSCVVPGSFSWTSP